MLIQKQALALLALSQRLLQSGLLLQAHTMQGRIRSLLLCYMVGCPGCNLYMLWLMQIGRTEQITNNCQDPPHDMVTMRACPCLTKMLLDFILLQAILPDILQLVLLHTFLRACSSASATAALDSAYCARACMLCSSSCRVTITNQSHVRKHPVLLQNLARKAKIGGCYTLANFSQSCQPILTPECIFLWHLLLRPGMLVTASSGS